MIIDICAMGILYIEGRNSITHVEKDRHGGSLLIYFVFQSLKHNRFLENFVDSGRKLLEFLY